MAGWCLWGQGREMEEKDLDSMQVALLVDGL
jgi:hypothetical protein